MTEMAGREPSRPTSEPGRWLFVGLGNPGREYEGTRHNVGFEVIERLARRHGIALDQRKHQGVFGKGIVEGTEAVLLRPLTYMNHSGHSVAPIARFFRIPPARIVVVADDLDLPVGRVKARPKGGSAGHNGHKSIAAQLGTQDYPRIRIGIGRVAGTSVTGHVLGRFSPEERALVDEAVERAVEGLERIARDGLERALTWINSSPD